MRKRGLIPKRQESKSRWHTLEEYEEALRLSCGFKSECARILNVAPASVTSRIDKSEHLQNVLAEISEQALDFSEKQLFSAIADREGWAILFHLRCKGKLRGWQERHVIDLTANVKAGVLVVPGIIEDHKEWEAKAIAQQRKLLSDDEDDEDDYVELEEGEIPEYEKPEFDIPQF